jgi:hypothetical protein
MLSTMCFVLQPLYTSSRMSQILAEALQDVQWAEEQLEAAETALLTRNCTQHQQLLPTVRQLKLWWLPPVKPVKHANASAPLPPRLPPRLPLRLPPWSPASLFMRLPPWSPASLFTGRRRVSRWRLCCSASRRSISRTSRRGTTRTSTSSSGASRRARIICCSCTRSPSRSSSRACLTSPTSRRSPGAAEARTTRARRSQRPARVAPPASRSNGTVQRFLFLVFFTGFLMDFSLVNKCVSDKCLELHTQTLSVKAALVDCRHTDTCTHGHARRV